MNSTLGEVSYDQGALCVRFFCPKNFPQGACVVCIYRKVPVLAHWLRQNLVWSVPGVVFPAVPPRALIDRLYHKRECERLMKHEGCMQCRWEKGLASLV